MGVGYTCVLMEEGNVLCWGKNDLGQLGTGYNQSALQVNPTPQVIIGPVGFRQ